MILDAPCGLGPPVRGCYSERTFRKYQRATFCLSAFSNLNLHETFIFALIFRAQKALRGCGHTEQPHPMLSYPCWGRGSPQNSQQQVWFCSLRSKVCQGGRQVWAAAQSPCWELASHPVHGSGWSRVAAARVWHSLRHAAIAQLLGIPQSAEGLQVSLKRVPKYKAHSSWGCFSHRQDRQLPFGRGCAKADSSSPESLPMGRQPSAAQGCVGPEEETMVSLPSRPLPLS